MRTVVYSHDENDPLGTSLPVLLLDHTNENEWKNAGQLRSEIEDRTGHAFAARRITVALTALSASALGTVSENGHEVSLRFLRGDGRTHGKWYQRTALGTLTLNHIKTTPEDALSTLATLYVYTVGETVIANDKAKDVMPDTKGTVAMTDADDPNVLRVFWEDSVATRMVHAEEIDPAPSALEDVR